LGHNWEKNAGKNLMLVVPFKESLVLKLEFALLKDDLLARQRVPAPPRLHLLIGIFHGRKSLCDYVR
jgi:hypothetical protein